MKNKKSHILFLFAWMLILLLGAGLYISFFIKMDYFEISPPIGALLKGSAITTSFEEDLSRELSVEKHPIIKNWARIKKAVLKTSITPVVVEGQNNWLFIHRENNYIKPVLQSMGIYRYSAYRLKMWSLFFRQRQAWTQAQGMDYVLVITPNKASVYPEFLPARFTRQRRQPSRDQLKEALQEINVIDLTDSIINKKNQGILFLKNDSHWNQLGAFWGYQALMRALPPPYRATPLSLEDCNIITDTAIGGDLARHILEASGRSEVIPRIEIKAPYAQLEMAKSSGRGSQGKSSFFVNADSTLPRAFFDHDSFFLKLRPFFAEHFSKSGFTWGWQGFNTDLILQDASQLVVDEFIERSIMGKKPRNPWPVIQNYWSKHFDTLPLLATYEEITFQSLPGALEITPFPKGRLPVLQLQIQPEKTDKLIIDYGTEKGYYWLRPKGEVYYVELKPGKVMSFQVENGTSCTVRAELRVY